MRPDVADRAPARLEVDLADRTWDRRYGHLRRTSVLDGGLRIVSASGFGSR